MKSTKRNIKYEVSAKPTNVYELITNRITEQLAQGIVPWHKPWVGGAGAAIKYESGEPYSLLNQILLGREGEWLPWGLIQKLGGKVKKGAHGQMCVWSKTGTKTEKDEETGEDKVTEFRYLKWYRVWHISDIEGIESKVKPIVPNPDLKPIEVAEQVVRDYVARETPNGFKFVNDQPSGEAYYSPTEDKVVVPMLSQHDCAEEYYSTTFHEFTHSTMKASRCDRVSDNSRASFGGEKYSREELVAEIGSAMLLNRTGIEIEKTFKNNVAYIANWLKALKNDTRMISWAATRAEKAAKYILNEV